MRACILSSEEYLNKIQEDLKLKEILSQSIDCEICAWEKLTADEISTYDVFVVRSVWGYHKSYTKFIQLLDTIIGFNKYIVNGYKNIIDNMSKQLQFDLLSNCNIATIPSVFIKDFEDIGLVREKLKKYFQLDDDGKVVIKPSISASGNNLVIEKIKSLELNPYRDVFQDDYQSICIQPFINGVNGGEYSAIVVDNKLQYVVKRFPGVVTKKKQVGLLRRISSQLNDRINQVIQMLNDRGLTFYRIDFFKINNNFYVNEIEMIDPDLFTRKINEELKYKCLNNLALTILNNIKGRD